VRSDDVRSGSNSRRAGPEMQLPLSTQGGGKGVSLRLPVASIWRNRTTHERDNIPSIRLLQFDLRYTAFQRRSPCKKPASLFRIRRTFCGQPSRFDLRFYRSEGALRIRHKEFIIRNLVGCQSPIATNSIDFRSGSNASFWHPPVNFRSTPKTGHGANSQEFSHPAPRGDSTGSSPTPETSPSWRSARSWTAVRSPSQVCCGLGYHRATAKQYCSSSSFVARHLPVSPDLLIHGFQKPPPRPRTATSVMPPEADATRTSLEGSFVPTCDISDASCAKKSRPKAALNFKSDY